MGLVKVMRPLLWMACLGGLYGWALQICEKSGGLDVAEVYASDSASADMEFGVTCQREAVTIYLPDTKYSISLPHQSPTTDTCSATLNSASPINGIPLPQANCQRMEDSRVEISSATPIFKVAGLLCQSVHGMSVDVSNPNTSLHPETSVMIASPQTTTWQKQAVVTHDASTLFGTNGRIWNSAIDDGHDYDNSVNGEVVFGGRASQGGSRTVIRTTLASQDSNDTAMPQTQYTFSPHQL
ncbi:MAG: hypothetical protein COV45_04420 [Deltaproteobacteria bacterium CG11_big_fil_rev_8_21_14_0_20_47_16]|nr:MAG: hypothetical protein COV45_04420 [Deltaproteobacteria bacterium CG11_big_fil_rev_8_21_14_0_20_47_16]